MTAVAPPRLLPMYWLYRYAIESREYDTAIPYVKRQGFPSSDCEDALLASCPYSRPSRATVSLKPTLQSTTHSVISTCVP